MVNIVAVMCVVGDPTFFKFASHSIPSFLRNNIDTDLRIFTDKPDEIEQYLCLSDRMGIINIKDYFNSHPENIRHFRNKGRDEAAELKHRDEYGYMFRDIYPAAMPAMAEEILKDKGYTHILKIDSDSYFAGGNVMAMVRTEVLNNPHIEVFLIERRHPLMHHYGGGVPGSGFTLWKIGGGFVPEYIRSFGASQQVTILAMRFSHKVVLKILVRPSFHFVRPFWKAKLIGMEFTKATALKFLPAYFHLHGKIALEGFAKMEEWFGEKTI